MKKGDTLFNEQFIILHDVEGEVILRKSEIISLQRFKHIGDEYYTHIETSNNSIYHVRESVEEVLELL